MLTINTKYQMYQQIICIMKQIYAFAWRLKSNQIKSNIMKRDERDFQIDYYSN